MTPMTANGKPQRKNGVWEWWSNGLPFKSLNHSALSSWPKGSQLTVSYTHLTLPTILLV